MFYEVDGSEGVSVLLFTLAFLIFISVTCFFQIYMCYRYMCPPPHQFSLAVDDRWMLIQRCLEDQ